MVDYTPLWKTIHEREITQYAMLQDKVLDNHTLDSLKRIFLGCSRFLPASVNDHFSGSSVGSGSLRLLFL